MDIAKVLGAKRRGDGHILVANDDVGTWAVGRLLEQAELHAYDETLGGI